MLPLWLQRMDTQGTASDVHELDRLSPPTHPGPDRNKSTEPYLPILLLVHRKIQRSPSSSSAKKSRDG